MKNLGQMTHQPQHLIVRRALVATSILIVSLAPTVALTQSPATEASCAGIKAAYPILGQQCENQYNNINHAPANADQRYSTYNTRVSVVKIFNQALLCNGLLGANKQAQQKFRSAEDGHLTAIANLRTAMVNAHDKNIPNLFTKNDLPNSINKAQCK